MADLNAQAYSIANQLGRQALDINEAKLGAYENKTLQYNLLDKADKQKASDDETKDVEKDIASVPKVYKTTTALLRAGRAGVVGTARGIAQSSNEIGSGEVLGSAVIRGAKGATAELSRAGEGAKIFGKGATAAEDITGVEGIVTSTLLKAGGGEKFAKIAGKGAGLLGAGLAIGDDIDNFFSTGNIFNKVGTDGKVEKQTLGEDVGNVATIVGGALDVVAAFTGGALAPVAAAVNIAAATDSTVSSIEADKAEKQRDTKEAPPAKPPPAVAPAAFAQYGLLANQSHNPLQHIGGN